MDLTDNEKRVLSALADEERMEVDEVARETGVGEGPAEQACYLLQEKDLADVEETVEERYVATEEGVRYAREGLPETRIYNYVVDSGGEAEISDLQKEVDDFGVGMGHVKKKGWVDVEGGVLHARDDETSDDVQQESLEAVVEGDGIESDLGEELAERNLVERETRRHVEAEVTGEGVGIAGEIDVDYTAETAGRLTKEMLETGDWREVEFESYNVEADAEPVFGGRKHILRQVADRVKEVLTSMGFREMRGPHVDSEFYINDCLFMPQDHPARTHWDKFLIEDPTHIDDLPDEEVENVRNVHLEGAEDGEGYHSEWNRDVARQLNLRGHTTSLTTRYLSDGPEPPQRYFAVNKVYRNDTIDPTHLLEFFQIEGWVMARDLSVRDLMGTFVEFYREFGITDLEFKPHYNPYTEPSFEIFGEHPETGELIEIGNSGMFRREVLEPHGIDDDVDVIAWGLALERLLMLMYGFEDIRDVHGTMCDLELLREVPVLWQ
ncbi:MAG: phenylalanine--tRNA ligase subunit alpha [Halobacteria archaeon]